MSKDLTAPKLHDCRGAFTAVLERLAATDDKIVAVCNDSVGSSKLGGFKSKWPERLVNVGIAEQDLVGVGALHAAHTLGIAVPSRLSVVGFDDILIAAHTVPALTTLRMPIGEIVGWGVSQAVALARDPSERSEPGLAVFPLPLIIRDSTAPPS